jgi:hypothetical protein
MSCQIHLAEDRCRVSADLKQVCGASVRASSHGSAEPREVTGWRPNEHLDMGDHFVLAARCGSGHNINEATLRTIGKSLPSGITPALSERD